MLDKLLNTKLKKKILGVFFSVPNRSFTARELRQAVESTERAVNETLRELVRRDLVQSATKKRQKIFRLNARYPLYAEISDLVLDKNSNGYSDGVTRALKKIPHLDLAVLSGVFTFQPNLTLDLLVVGDGVSRLRLQNLARDIADLTGLEINYTLLSRGEFESRRMLSDRFIRDVLDNPYLVVVDHSKHLS